MKVEVLLAEEFIDPVAEIKTNKMTSTIEKAIKLLKNEEFEDRIAIQQAKEIVFVDRSAIYLIRTEVGKVIVYDAEGNWYETKTTLGVFEQTLGNQFIRISKSSLINLSAVQSVKASFSGTLDITLENGLEDVISRKYRPNFKKKIGV
ncbi:LytTR family DNA-binding domain-containing protein [Solibacillus sp. FSL R7-0682]|uniref:LytTR family DNA-binding domain-containing protein n=1 Tax=Solibacillus sp. FSL R7-0682 TaxID=2921690 RepID=UPI0030F7D1AE